MRIRKLIYIIMLSVFMLTACGKPDTKDLEQKESQEQSKEESLDKGEDSEESQETEDKSDANKENDSPSGSNTSNNNSSNGTTTQNPTGGNTESSGTITQNPTTGSSTQKPSNGSTTTPSNGSANTGGTSNTGSNNSTNTGSTTTKKPVKRVSEDVKSDVVPYKYGITKYDMTTNYYTVFSDDSKELLYSNSYTVYDTSNYSATDSQLKSEADSNASKYMSYYQEVLRLVNEIRAEAGVGPLTLDTTLCQAASMRALEMDYSNQMSHTRPNGSTCWSVLDFYGVSTGTCGENIAAGQSSAASVVKGWKSSPSHYQNMINASFTKLGVGYSAMGVGDYGHYWCQLFTN